MPINHVDGSLIMGLEANLTINVFFFQKTSSLIIWLLRGGFFGSTSFNTNYWSSNLCKFGFCTKS